MQTKMQTARPVYFTAFPSVKMTRDAQDVLVVEFHTNGGPLTFAAQDHTDFVEAFYRIAQDRANKIVILTEQAESSSRGSIFRPSATSPTQVFGAKCTTKVFKFSKTSRTFASR